MEKGDVLISSLSDEDICLETLSFKTKLLKITFQK